MESKALCDPCVDEDKSNPASKYCSECEEKLCKECADSHVRFKAFKSHHLIDFELADSRLPQASSIYCQTHPDFQLDLFCNQHDVLCCCACVPVTHKNCLDVLPIKVASRDIKTSTLLSDSMRRLSDLSEPIAKLSNNREKNRTSLEQTKQSIIAQISDAKIKLLKEIDNIEQKLIADLNSICHKNEIKISKEEEELSDLACKLIEREEQLEFLKDHGSDRQLFITLRHLIKENKQTEAKIQSMTSDLQDMNIQFVKHEEIQIRPMGYIEEVVQPCNIKYKGTHQTVAQVQQGKDRTLTEFQQGGKIELKPGIEYRITGMAVTVDNSLFICNYNFRNSNVYVYKDFKTYATEIKLPPAPYDIAVLPQSDRAVVTLPYKSSIQFINTKNCTTGEKIDFKQACYGVTASTDKIFLGGHECVLILRHNGLHITKVVTKKMNIGWIENLCFNEQRNQLQLRYSGHILCVTLEGEVVYRYEVTGCYGVAVDHQGNVYVSSSNRNEIHRLSPDGQFLDVVMNKDKGLDKPYQITFSRSDFSRFIVVTNDFKSVSVYSCN